MLVDLNHLMYKDAFELINWCIENGVDLEQAIRLNRAWFDAHEEDFEWTLDIPEEVLSYFLLKWDSHYTSIDT